MKTQMGVVVEIQADLLNMQTEAARQLKLLKNQGEANRTLYQNQQNLSETASALDDRFAVMFRIVMSTLNKVLADSGKEEVGPEVLEEEFVSWNKFKRHPDWNKYTPAWYMGLDVSEVLKEVEEFDKAPDQPKEPAEDQREHTKKFTPEEMEEAGAVLKAAGLSPDQVDDGEPSIALT